MRAREFITEHKKYFGGFKRTPTASETQRYMRGWCPYFALALHKVFGYRMLATNGHILAQAPQGDFVDVRGFMTDEEAHSGIGSSFSPVSED
jgi:hypothetical protein